MRSSHRVPLALSLLLVGVPAATRAQGRSGDDSADAHFERGQQILEHGEAKIPSPWGILSAVTVWEDLKGAIGKDYVSRARDEFQQAIALDSTHAGAAVELGKLAAGSREPDDLRDAAGALSTASRPTAAPKDVWLWRARVAVLLGDPSAAEYARCYEEHGGDVATARLLGAQAAFAASRDSLGAALYLDGAARMSEAAAAAYFQDLAPIARAAERKEWDDEPPARRGEWVERFWARRAAESGASPGERIAEHYHRLRVAVERYRRTGKREAGITDVSAIRLSYHEDALDDRGLVYVLVGAPDTIVRTVGADLPNESWFYRRPTGNFMLHFVAPRRAAEFALVADPLRAASPCLSTTEAMGCSDRILEMLEDRAALEPRFGLLAERYRTALSAARHLDGPQERQLASITADFTAARDALAADATRAAVGALSHDSFVPSLGVPLPFYYDTYAFRGANGRTDMLVAVAVPGTALQARPAPDGVVYGLDLDVLVTDTTSARAFHADSVRFFRAPKRLGDAENLRATMELELPPGTGYAHRVTVKAAAGGSGTAYAGPLVVPAFSGDTAMMSDVVMAEGAGKGWRRGDVELALVPPRQFPEAAVVSLFYELYNVPAGALFRTRIRVAPVGGAGVGGAVKKLFGKGRAPISLSFNEQARPGADGVTQMLRRVDMRSLKPGVYRLEVEMAMGSRVLRRTREFAVR